MKPLQLHRLFKKIFGGDGEELGGIHGTVLVQESDAVTDDITP